MSSDPNYQWEDLLDIDDSDLPLTPVLRPCNRHVREIITITSIQNTDGIVQVKEVEEKPVRIIPGPVGILQLAKIRKQSDINEGGDDSVLSTQDYGGIRQWVFQEAFKIFLKNGKLEHVVAIIKSCSPNALGDLKVTIKDLSETKLPPPANDTIFAGPNLKHRLPFKLRLKPNAGKNIVSLNSTRIFEIFDFQDLTTSAWKLLDESIALSQRTVAMACLTVVASSWFPLNPCRINLELPLI
ncbi:hypothetical protein Tco_1176093 [Tanacetum coccineum]